MHPGQESREHAELSAHKMQRDCTSRAFSMMLASHAEGKFRREDPHEERE
jgi:hypothetical protein